MTVSFLEVSLICERVRVIFDHRGMVSVLFSFCELISELKMLGNKLVDCRWFPFNLHQLITWGPTANRSLYPERACCHFICFIFSSEGMR